MNVSGGDLATDPLRFWALDPDATLAAVGSRSEGLRAAEALARAPQVRRIGRSGPSDLRLLWGQLRSPMVLLLLAAAALSGAVGERTDTIIIAGIVAISAALGFWQERGATRAVERLMRVVERRATVLRDGVEVDLPLDALVPGDVVRLRAGSVVPGDCRLLDERELHVDEASLTGETFPVEKDSAAVAADAPLSGRSSALYFGTHVISGTGRAVVVAVGADTELGHIAARLSTEPLPSEFERGVERFGRMIAGVTSLLAVLLLAANLGMHRPVVESLLYSLALAVGLVPEMLPAIVSLNLARGARQLAKANVIVKRLSSIDDLGSMDVLCTDKTGTLTEGTVRLERAVDPIGAPSTYVLRESAINASFETGMSNNIDDALRALGVPMDGVEKLDEVPYDFVRKRISVLVREGGQTRMITKGAVPQVLAVCTTATDSSGQVQPIEAVRGAALATFQQLSAQGLRCLAVATAATPDHDTIDAAHETDLRLLGFLAFFDPPKAGIETTLRALGDLGVRLVMITGDNREVAASIAARVGLSGTEVLTGPELRQISDEALPRRVEAHNVFAEIEPTQKERLILALRRGGHVVGYLGDGINDAPALHAAHIGLSVDTAVDVAREAAQIVLLRHDLAVLVEGVRLGRATLANTLKYVYITSSANFGNMVSMAAAGVFLPFLPLLPKQILLNNLLSDLPAMTIASDRVDDEHLARARRWDTAAILRFMMMFGAISSLFDIATFVLLRLLDVAEPVFQSAWFVESLLTEIAILVVMRTRRPFLHSRPSAALLGMVVGVSALAIALPYLPLGRLFGLVPIPIPILGLLLALTLSYLVVSESAKHLFFAARRTQGAHRADSP